MASAAKSHEKIKDNRRFKTQPGNRELITIIESVKAIDRAISLALVFREKYQQSSGSICT